MGMTRRVDQSVIDRYADVSGDRNPLHIDPTFAIATTFGTTIAHGMLVASYIVQAQERSSSTEKGAFNPFTVEFIFVAPVPVDSEVEVVPSDSANELHAMVGGAPAAIGRFAILAYEGAPPT
jgi:3-hydroxybutyryl-CoA dehydratase